MSKYVDLESQRSDSDELDDGSVPRVDARVPRRRAAHRRRTTLLAAGLLLLAVLGATAAYVLWPVADSGDRHGSLGIVRARIWAGDGRWHSALVADRRGQILYLGNDSAAAANLLAPAARAFDFGEARARERIVVPAFQDSHIHLHDGGLDGQSCQLFDAANASDALALVRACVRALPSDERFLLGAGYALPVFGDAGPNKAMLDEIVGDRDIGVFVWAADGHSCWLNSVMLARAGVAPTSNGNLHEKQCASAATRLPPVTMDKRKAAILAAQNVANDAGITSIIEANADRAILQAYRELESEGKLNMHVHLSIGWEALEDGAKNVSERARQIADLHSADDVLVRPRSAKLFIDGVLETGTAWLVEPYVGGGTGEPRNNQSDLNEIVRALYEHDVNVHAHAIGDGAVRAILNAHEFAQKATGKKQEGAHIAHNQLVAESDVARFAALGVTSNWQPFWFERDQYVTELTIPKLGQKRSARMYPMQDVISTGARFVCGSDWTVSSLEPLRAIARAVRRSGHAGDEPLAPDQAIGVEDAASCYATHGATLVGQSDDFGTLAVGKEANFVVLDRDIFAVDPQTNAIDNTAVLATYFRGKQVAGAPLGPMDD